MPPRTRNSPFAASGSGRKTKKARTSEEPTAPSVEEQNLAPPAVQERDSDSPPPPPQDNEEDTEPLQPEKLFFPHTEFCKTIKIASKCEDSNTIKALDVLGRDEKKWFANHPQFKHIWHMPRQKNHKLMVMWLTLLRTVVMEKDWEMCWFVVNGVPIRYSLREHGLISGLDCQKYPRYYKQMGSTRFVKRNFGDEAGGGADDDVPQAVEEEKKDDEKDEDSEDHQKELTLSAILMRCVEKRKSKTPTPRITKKRGRPSKSKKA